MIVQPKQEVKTLAPLRPNTDKEPKQESPLPFFKSVWQLTSEKEQLFVLPTGCSGIDDCLGGGLHAGEITELVGSSTIGKTQLCLQAAVRGSLWDLSTLYIDSVNSCVPERLLELYREAAATNQNSPNELQALSRIRIHRLYSIQNVLKCLDNVRIELEQQESLFSQQLRFIVIDSVAALISPIIGGLSREGHYFMNALSRSLKSLASDFGIAVLITNQTVSNMKDKMRSVNSHNSPQHTLRLDWEAFSDSKPALGESWSYVADMRLMMLFENAPSPIIASTLLPQHRSRIAVLTKSARSAVGASCLYNIDQRGIISVGHNDIS